MARETLPVEINKFTGGLITDTSPLNSPDNASLQEENFVLNIDGSRSRRLGLDFETNFQSVSTTITGGDDTNIATSSYRWRNAGGSPDKAISVIQFGNEVKFFDLAITPISDNLIYTTKFAAALPTDVFSYATVDGVLIITTGEKTPYIFQVDESNNITVTTQIIKIRDFLGVEDVYGDDDLFEGSGIQVRPIGLTQAHTYNLRNQSWGVPRPRATGPGLAFDPLRSMIANGEDEAVPSNSDTVTQALYPDPQNSDNRLVDRFWPLDVVRNPIGSTPASSGYFIIDALERGASRIAEDDKNRSTFPELFRYPVTTLPEDRTPGGPSVVTEYAGRAWFAGFSGEVIDGDNRSPKMSSYILFSKLVRNISDITQCYQEGDPTSKDAPDIVDTDGGFIRINEAYGIKALINLGSSLMVVASNGVWRISGGTENGFTATTYIVEKITDRGCVNKQSVVSIDNTFMFWGDDGIYHVTTDQFGSYVCNNLTFSRIQTLFDNISASEKRSAKAAFDSYERKVRWLYGVQINSRSDVMELVLDVGLNAFTLNRVKSVDGAFPRVVNYIVGNTYLVDTSDIPVTVNDEPVTVGGEQVTTSTDVVVSSVSRREVFYVVMTQNDPTITYTFGLYSNRDFLDWFAHDGVGIDTPAFLVTNYLSGGDFQRDKQIPFLTIYLRKTETGFEESGGDWAPVGASSCIVQSMWEWTNSANANKWGRPFQAYRHRRFWAPATLGSDFNDGNLLVVTRNKLRGNGRVLSLKISTEPGKNLHLYGWSLILSVAGSV